ncbi:MULTISPECIES: hypothetical protein [Paenibacillus]|uniref:Uncharacterized protein n=1 Tax=Paenibacillus odorifer TaxID=189426 RepID=A0ABX3HWR5_9BACL|nr:hypothetical protein [Paenibacillus odorifer]OMD55248.1 hypothetical protein BSK51_04135 [Paenibacillus odorifer]
MPIPQNVLTIEMAEYVSSYVLNRGGWDDCTPEKILERATNFEELHKWMSIATKSPRTPFPKNPKESDVIYVIHDGTSYCYFFVDGEWKLVDAAPTWARNF